MNSKTNEILNDIIHTASQAILAEDEAVKRQALGDISCAIASLVPTESVVYRTPKHIVDFIYETCNVPFADQTDPAFLKKVAEKFKLVERSSELKGIEKFLTAADGVKFVRFAGKDETRLVARRKGTCGNKNTIFEIRVDHKEDLATVTRDGVIMFDIQGETIGHSFVEKLAISAMHRYFKENRMTNEKKKRKRARIAAERAGILTPEQELAETVERQKDDDDLAQRLENA